MSQPRTRSWLPITCIAVLVALTCYVGVFCIARWLTPWWAYDKTPSGNVFVTTTYKSWFATVMYPLRYAAARWFDASNYLHPNDLNDWVYLGIKDSHLVFCPPSNWNSDSLILPMSDSLNRNSLHRLEMYSHVKISVSQKLVMSPWKGDTFAAEVTGVEPKP